MSERETSAIGVVATSPEHAETLEALQRVVFPTLADEERFKKEHYLKHVELFPEGQLVALDAAGEIVGATSTIRWSFDFEHTQHTFAEVLQGGWLTSHDPDGEWLYGCDLGTHPRYRGRGIARQLYAARQDVVRRLGLRGQVTVGLLAGYGELAGEMSVESYYQALLAGERTDPTVSVQMHLGFEPRGLVPNYVDDPGCGHCGVLLVLTAEKELRSRREQT